MNPLAGLAALAAVVPLVAFIRLRRRARRVRSALRLGSPRSFSGAVVVSAIVVLAGLVGVASTQPVLLDTKPRYVRTDAEAFVVFDITRSMLAREGASAPTRLERAREAAREIRADLADLPVGIASFTNRAVPHLFPTSSRPIFSAALERVIRVENPPPDASEAALVTAFDALAPLATHNFFSPDARSRVAVVLTDGESRPVVGATISALRADPPVRLVIVRVWSLQERIFRESGEADPAYEPDPTSTATLQAFADAVDAPLFDEGETRAAAGAMRRLLGEGPRVQQGEEVTARPLAAWAIGFAVVPLAYLLWRRNF